MLEIERLWGKQPGWLRTQPRETRVQLLAWYRIHLRPDGGSRRRRTHPAVEGSDNAQAFWLGGS